MTDTYDFYAFFKGGVTLLLGNNDRAREWITATLGPDLQTFGIGVVVPRDKVVDTLLAIHQSGMTLETN